MVVSENGVYMCIPHTLKMVVLIKNMTNNRTRNHFIDICVYIIIIIYIYILSMPSVSAVYPLYKKCPSCQV